MSDRQKHMRVLVFPGSHIVGGSEINAVDLAAGVQALGHDVAPFSAAGPVSDLARDKDLEVIEARFLGECGPRPWRCTS